MKTPASRTSAIRCLRSGSRGAYCALMSTRGMLGTPVESRGPPPPEEIDDPDDDRRDDRVLDVAEGVVEVLIAPADGVPDPGKCEAPERRAGEREHVVAAERRAEHTGRDRDEGACD